MKLENLEGILEGKWEIKNKYFHYKLNREKIIFRGCLLGGIYDYEIVSNMYQFRDFLKETFKNKTYKKENEKYLRKFLKVCELWIVDYLSRTTYNADTNSLCSEFINEYPTKYNFEITFDKVLKKRKEILKNNEFFVLLLEKENLFKKIKNYQYMLRFRSQSENEIKIKFHHFLILFDISNVWDIKHKILIINNQKQYDVLNIIDVKRQNEIYNEILSVFPKVKKIIEKAAEQYIKKYR